MGVLLTETRPTDAPKHLFCPLFPHNPFFPRLRSGHRLFQGPPAESKVLAASGIWQRAVASLNLKMKMGVFVELALSEVFDFGFVWW